MQLVVPASIRFSCVSLLIMVAISLDRYIALFFHLKYSKIVITKRVCVVLAINWSSAVFLTSTWLWNFTLFYSLFACFLVISVAYIKIYRGLRHRHGFQLQDQAHVQHAGRGKVQKISIQHVVDLLSLYTLLPAFRLCVLVRSIFLSTISSFSASLNYP